MNLLKTTTTSSKPCKYKYTIKKTGSNQNYICHSDAANARIEEQKTETEKVRRSMCAFFDLDQHDFSFISNARKFNLVEAAKKQAVQIEEPAQ